MTQLRTESDLIDTVTALSDMVEDNAKTIDNLETIISCLRDDIAAWSKRFHQAADIVATVAAERDEARAATATQHGLYVAEQKDHAITKECFDSLWDSFRAIATKLDTVTAERDAFEHLIDRCNQDHGPGCDGPLNCTCTEPF